MPLPRVCHVTRVPRVARWMCYCHVPTICTSMVHWDPAAVFGRSVLRLLLRTVSARLLQKIDLDREKMAKDKRLLILAHMPRSVGGWGAGCRTDCSLARWIECSSLCSGDSIGGWAPRSGPPIGFWSGACAHGKALPTILAAGMTRWPLEALNNVNVYVFVTCRTSVVASSL